MIYKVVMKNTVVKARICYFVDSITVTWQNDLRKKNDRKLRHTYLYLKCSNLSPPPSMPVWMHICPKVNHLAFQSSIVTSQISKLKKNAYFNSSLFCINAYKVLCFLLNRWTSTTLYITFTLSPSIFKIRMLILQNSTKCLCRWFHSLRLAKATFI